MAVIVGGVVNEDADGAELFANRDDGGFQRIDVGDVAADEVSVDLCGEGITLGFEQVDEADAGALAGKGADDVGANARCAAGDEDNPAGEAGIAVEDRNFSRL